MATEGDPIWSIALCSKVSVQQILFSLDITTDRMPEGTETYTIDSPYVRLSSHNNSVSLG